MDATKKGTNILWFHKLRIYGGWEVQDVSRKIHDLS